VSTLVARRVPIAAVSFTAHDPDADPDCRFGETALQAIGVVAQAVVTASEHGGLTPGQSA
jgi:hypothetical protein